VALVAALFGFTRVSAAAALSQNAAGLSVQLRGDPSRHFNWVVDADGLHSQVRRLEFGPGERFEKPICYVVSAAEDVGDRLSRALCAPARRKAEPCERPDASPHSPRSAEAHRDLLARPGTDAPCRTLNMVLRTCGTLIPATAICSNSDDFARAMRGAGERIQRDALSRIKVGPGLTGLKRLP